MSKSLQGKTQSIQLQVIQSGYCDGINFCNDPVALSWLRKWHQCTCDENIQKMYELSFSEKHRRPSGITKNTELREKKTEAKDLI